MVGKLLALIHGEIRGLHEAAYLLGMFAFFSQVLALVRDRLLAHSFGANVVLDVYYASFRIPDIIFVSIASFVSVYVLIPFITRKEGESKEEEKRFIDSVFSVFFTAIAIAGVALYAAAPALTRALFPGIAGGEMADELVALTRLLLLQPVFLGLSNLLGSITQTRGRFLLYAVSPLFYNAGIIAGVLFLYPLFGLSGLGMGVVVGAFLHLAVQLPFIITRGYFPTPTLRVNIHDIKRVVLLSLPRTIALSANHVALLFLAGLASLMAEGSITVFQFSFNLQTVPLSIIAVSYSVAAFPTLSRYVSDGDTEKFLAQILTAARHIIFWSLPAIALFVVLRAQIVRVILGSGAFDWTATRLTAAALALFIISLVAQGLILLFVRGYYAAGNTVKPLVVNVVGAALVVLFAFGFTALFEQYPLWRYFIESLLRVEGIPGTNILMLPLGYSLATILTGCALLFLFRKDFRSVSGNLAPVFFQSVSAAVVLGFVARLALNVLDDVFDINTFAGIFLQGLLAGILGIAAYVAVLHLLMSKELSEAWRSFHKKFWKAKTIAPERMEL